jgi:ribokinase
MPGPVIIVPGGMNTDIVGMGVDRILGPGELSLGGEIHIGPGGKARNMAQMAAAYIGPGKVAMIGRSCKDPFGLYDVPLKALEEAGVDMTCIRVLDHDQCRGKYPGIALIPVDKKGKNQIYVLPGVNADFGKEDIDFALKLFANPHNNKIMVLALEIPLEAVEYSLKKARKNSIKAVLDPGGINAPVDSILDERIFLIKPNEHEAKILTGKAVYDLNSAGKAADVLLKKGIQNVLITHGARGAYFFNREQRKHFPVPKLEDSGTHDETGCGDQVTAVVAAGLAEKRDLIEVVTLAIRAGTMQFYRKGIQPLGAEEILASIEGEGHEKG